MAKKLTVEQFIGGLSRMSQGIQQKVYRDWGKNTLEAMRQAKIVAPKKVGTLRNSARAVQPKITNQGIVSAFIFGVPYAYRLEKGVDEAGKRLNIVNEGPNRNPLARSGYASHGVKMAIPGFMKDIKSAISIAWRNV